MAVVFKGRTALVDPSTDKFYWAIGGTVRAGPFELPPEARFVGSTFSPVEVARLQRLANEDHSPIKASSVSVKSTTPGLSIAVQTVEPARVVVLISGTAAPEGARAGQTSVDLNGRTYFVTNDGGPEEVAKALRQVITMRSRGAFEVAIDGNTENGYTLTIAVRGW